MSQLKNKAEKIIRERENLKIWSIELSQKYGSDFLDKFWSKNRDLHFFSQDIFEIMKFIDKARDFMNEHNLSRIDEITMLESLYEDGQLKGQSNDRN